MDGDVIHGWWSLLVADPSDETDGMIHRRPMPSMEIHSIHGWRISMSGMQHMHSDTEQEGVTKANNA